MYRKGYYTVPVGEASGGAYRHSGYYRDMDRRTLGNRGRRIPQWDIEIIDLRTLLPLDFATIEKASVRRIVH